MTLPLIGITASSSKKIYVVGDVGPAGGIVFYDAGSTLSWGRWLEAATSSTSPSWTDTAHNWLAVTTSVPTANATAIGNGMANTVAAVAVNGTTPFACTTSKAYSGGGFTGNSVGWFLPCKDELYQLYLQRNVVGGFAANDYWASSQNPSLTGQAWAYNFQNNSGGFTPKANAIRYRAVRAFS